MKKMHMGIVAVFVMVTMMGFTCNKTGDENVVQGGQGAPQNEIAMEEKNDESVGGKFMGGMKDLIGLGAQKCEWDTGDGHGGVMYTDGTRIRTEAKNAVQMGDEGAQDMHMIQDGDWMYTWSVQTKKGQKMNIKEMEKMAKKFENMAGDENMMEVEREDFDPQEMMDEEHEFACSKWKVDGDLFVPPSDVTFEDMSKMFEQAGEMMQQLEGACDEVPEAQRAACEDAMKAFGQ